MHDTDAVLSQAQMYLDSGRLLEARAAYARVCELDSLNAEARLMLGVIDGESGKTGDAFDNIQQAIHLRPDYEEAYLALATLQRAQGDAEGALKSCQRALDIDPDYEEAWLALGAIQGGLGQYQAAEASCRKVLEMWDDCVEAYVNLGSALKAQNKWKDAAASYRKALQLTPDRPDILVNLGSAYQQGNALQDALNCYQRAIELAPHKADGYAGRASALSALGQKQEAIDDYRKALDLDPGSVVSELGLCSAHVDLNQLEQAETSSAAIVEKLPQSEIAHYNHGRVLQGRGLLDEAAACYRRAIEINSSHPRAHFYLGTIHHAQGLYDVALDSYAKVTEILPEFAPAYFRVGLMYQLLRKLDDAVAAYKRVLVLTQDGDEELRATACAQLGFVYKTLLQQKDQAIKYYQMVLEIDPEHTMAKHCLASLGIGDVPDQASDEYVAKLFDDMSEDFEHTLVHKLNYHTPDLINQAVRTAVADSAVALSVLDLGCGTGLCGPLVGDIAGYLAGIDLSPKMIKKAEEKRVYDSLIVGELTEVMSASEREYDLVLSADVFVYIGNLDSVFAACKKTLKPGGLFAFSTEAAEDGHDNGFILRDSGRYAHTLQYIRALSHKYRFEEIMLEEAVIRMEGDKPIGGRVFLLKNQVE